MKKERIKGRFAFKIDQGKVRVSNEDSAKVLVNSNDDVLMLVADGMGGAKKGDYASQYIVEKFTNAFKEKTKFSSILSIKYWLLSNLKKINKYLYNLSISNKEYKGMGSTLTMCFIHGDKAVILNVGDSRCYMIENKKMVQKTEDQTYVQYLIKSGTLSPEDAKTHPDRHALMNAIGIYPSLSADVSVVKHYDETIMICSDGLYNNVSEPNIENVLMTDDDLNTKVDTLINIANFNGGSDNISVAIWECGSRD